MVHLLLQPYFDLLTKFRLMCHDRTVLQSKTHHGIMCVCLELFSKYIFKCLSISQNHADTHFNSPPLQPLLRKCSEKTEKVCEVTVTAHLH